MLRDFLGYLKLERKLKHKTVKGYFRAEASERKIYLSEEVEPGKISHKIIEETGMSYESVRKRLLERA